MNHFHGQLLRTGIPYLSLVLILKHKFNIQRPTLQRRLLTGSSASSSTRFRFRGHDSDAAVAINERFGLRSATEAIFTASHDFLCFVFLALVLSPWYPGHQGPYATGRHELEDGKNDVVIANSDGITSFFYGKYTHVFFPTSKQLVSRPRR